MASGMSGFSGGNEAAVEELFGKRNFVFMNLNCQNLLFCGATYSFFG
jgi:hypothetical protein